MAQNLKELVTAVAQENELPHSRTPGKRQRRRMTAHSDRPGFRGAEDNRVAAASDLTRRELGERRRRHSLAGEEGKGAGRVFWWRKWKRRRHGLRRRNSHAVARWVSHAGERRRLRDDDFFQTWVPLIDPGALPFN